jgi:phthalate 4,5-cis-dihydrodiol dehydrogenase
VKTASTAPLGVVLVGCGEHAQETLVPAILSVGRRVRLVFCDQDASRAQSLCEEFSGEVWGTDPLAMLARDDISAVILAGPPELHFEVGLAAMEAGRHVLVEKPPARLLPQVEQLADSAARNGVVGMVGHNLRHSAAWRMANERLDFSTLESVHIAYHASGPRGGRWGLSPPEAFVLSHAVHVFDLLNSALGPASRTSHQFRRVEDGRHTLCTQWFSQRGVCGTATISTCAPRFTWSVEFTTSDGTHARIDSPTTLVVQGPRTDSEWGRGLRDVWNNRVLGDGYLAPGYSAEVETFVSCIAGSSSGSPSFADEVAVYRAIDDVFEQSEFRRD